MDGFFSPIYAQLGIDIFGEFFCFIVLKLHALNLDISLAVVFSNLLNVLTLFANTFSSGLGFITSITFIFLVGVFMSSWLGTSVLGLGEWFIKRMPLVRHIYNASKQISAAISPGVCLETSYS